eukprot:NODE_1504_length_2456_cov_6.787892.p1 GENE.NODE_1504_length_2456_cov_6.787892~~NODE_1504_length_2456_cov_6.787892.p1  ORF type:complete len:603 (+),score=187.96 NODE_1504_length_2456_cov_6.787892:57-1865(+)
MATMHAAGKAPSAEDVALCVVVLRQLKPADLQLPEMAELCAAGTALFTRHITKIAFGEKQVVDFLKEQSKNRKTVRELKRLESVIKDEHDKCVASAEGCGLNEKRKAKLAMIKAECAAEALSAKPLTLQDITSQPHLAPDVAAAAAAAGATSGAPAAEADNASTEPATDAGGAGTAGEKSALPPKGNFRNCCNVCRGWYNERHEFYHQLCHRCAEHNLEKRHQSADLGGYVSVVTGGRVRIGYKIVLKLLRAGSFVFTTTRYPADAALRYEREPDFEEWRHRLEVCGPVELSNMRVVESLCSSLRARFPRIHILINNAAQTLTRPPGWHVRMGQLESKAEAALPPAARALVTSPLEVARLMGGASVLPIAPPSSGCAPGGENSGVDAGAGETRVTVAGRAGGAECGEVDLWVTASEELANFPAGQLDDSRQPLDNSDDNSWSCRLGEISTLELLQTLAANAAAPFILCSQLMPSLAPSANDDQYGHVVNVSALEGKFSVGKKCNGHPHTNMGKAALNMLTYTSASSFFQRRVLMNAVDTGWVTDMAPHQWGVVAQRHATHVAPPLDEEDGAARVLDPIFSHVKDRMWLLRGQFFRNYYVGGW